VSHVSRRLTKASFGALCLVSILAFSTSNSAYADNVVTTVSLGGFAPVGFAFDPTNGDVYVASSGATIVPVISGSSNTVTANVTVGYDPTRIVFDSLNGNIYAANYDSGTVSVISGSTNAVVATVDVGQGPAAIAFDSMNGGIYVANQNSYTVSVISGSDNSLVATVPVGTNPNALAYDATNGDIYVANGNSCSNCLGSVSVISGSTNSVVANVSVSGFAEDVAFDSSNGNVYVASRDSAISVISGTTNTVAATVSLPSSSEGFVFDSNNGDIYVANAYSTVFVISGSTNSIVAMLPIGQGQGSRTNIGSYPSGVAFDPDNGDIYVTNIPNQGLPFAGAEGGAGSPIPMAEASTNPGSVSVISGSTNTLIQNVTVGGGPAGIAFDPDNGNIYVANSNPTYIGPDNFTGTVSVIAPSGTTAVPEFANQALLATLAVSMILVASVLRLENSRLLGRS
jgi:YVTN family beta-propeller protein